MRRAMLILWVLALLPINPCLAKWSTLEDCTLIPNEYNDGDSFHVRHRGHEYIFRLYFVDAPESDDSIPERVSEQAAWFGIDRHEVLRFGHEAARFTDHFLARGFTVLTEFKDAMGRSKLERFYALIRVDHQDLAEELVRHGLARIYGMDVDLPDGTKAMNFQWRLKTAEQEAKREKLGVWSRETAGKPSATVPHSGVEERDISVPRTVPVYSLKDPGVQVGILESGAQVHVLKIESPAMVRILIPGSSGTVFEAQCLRADLGL